MGRRYWELEGFLSRRPVCGAHSALDDVRVCCAVNFAADQCKTLQSAENQYLEVALVPRSQGVFFLVSFLFASSQAG